MTPRELLAFPVERPDNDLGKLFGFRFSHVPEVHPPDHLFGQMPEDPNFLIRCYRDFNYDGRRIWRLATVWFSRTGEDHQLAMIIRNAGREGDDFCDRFILSPEVYDDLVEYTLCLRGWGENLDAPQRTYFELDRDIPSLETFYGGTLEGIFRHGFF